MNAATLADVRAANAAAAACAAARAAQPGWGALDVRVRAAVMAAAARLLAEGAPAIASAIQAATGRPGAELWSGEIVPTLDALRWLGRRGARHLRPRPLRRSWLQWYFRATRHALCWEPFGVVGIVTPGNSFLFLAVPQIAAALLAGNAVLWKPAPGHETAAMRIVSLLQQAGLPPGLLQVVPGGPEAARDVAQGGADKLIFTGSSEAGRALYGLVAGRGRPAVLELSGRHVAVVLADADPELAARGIVWGKLANGGRNCVSVQRVLVERAMAAAFLDAAREAMGRLGPASLGPSLGPEECARLRGLVRDAVEAGARPLVGDGSGPTLLVDVSPGMRVVEEEIRGPILAVGRLDSEEDAVRQINGADHRLSASIWSSDVARARRLARRLDVGHVWINDELHPVAQPEVTLAGRGSSGFGAARGLPGLMEMVQPKVISETPPRARRRHYRPAGGGVVEMCGATVGLAFTPGMAGRAAALARLIRSLLRLVKEER
jgi:acyl-CoA reductase-like NAD-dependent aldehyde dehydrogenase